MAQSCSVNCPDGSTFTSTVNAGVIEALSQEEANAIAHSVACRNAQLRKICFSTDSILESACESQSGFFKQIAATGGVPITVSFDIYSILPQECKDSGVNIGDVIPYFWEVVSGSLPSGLSLGFCDGIISGSPTETGDFTFTIQIIDSIGSVTSKEFHLSIIGFSDSSPLPDGTESTAYSFTLAVTGGVSPISWEVVSGILPDGLTLNNATGEISGTPTVPGTFDFTVELLDSSP